MERALYIKNYRNIGFGKSERIVLNHSLEKGKMGDLVILIGANSAGKSNVLDALCSFSNKSFQSRDITTLSYEDQYRNPQISLCCKDNNNTYSYRISYNDPSSPYIEYPDKEKLNYSYNDELEEIISYLRENFDKVTVNSKSSRHCVLDVCQTILDTWGTLQQNELDSRISSVILHIRSFINWGYGQGCISYLRKTYPKSVFIKMIDESAQTADNIALESYENTYGVRLLPQVVRYTDSPLSNSHLSCSRKEINNSAFFLTVLKAINVPKETIHNAYQAFQQQGNNMGVLKTLERDINRKLSAIAVDFNKLYFAENDRYSFEITCSPESIYFSLYRGSKDISLDYQSTGFRWFFNLYFNLLCKNELQPGDIIVMDQPGMDLHVKGREELRRFLKEFARRNDLTIVIATHEPSMIDLDCLDEIRVVSMKDNQSSICNDFAAIDPDDPDCLKPIKDALTVENRILFDPDMNLVFVEGITDYNYLLAFKKLLGFKNLSFLPIKGVGNVKDADIVETQKAISRELIRLKKHDPILLVDSDKAGQSMKKINGQDSCLRVFTLADIDPAFKSIESLFDPEDLKKLGLVDENGKYVKHASDSAVIKNHIESYEFSETTKENFKKVLQHLDD